MFSIRTTGLQTTLIEQLNINNILEISEKTTDSLKNRRIVQKQSKTTSTVFKFSQFSSAATNLT